MIVLDKTGLADVAAKQIAANRIDCDSEDAALAEGERWLERRIDEQGHCNCRRKLEAGGSSDRYL